MVLRVPGIETPPAVIGRLWLKELMWSWTYRAYAAPAGLVVFGVPLYEEMRLRQSPHVSHVQAA